MRSKILMSAAATAAACSSVALAATLGVGTTDVGAGNASIVACDTNGFTESYTTSAGLVTGVTVSGIADPGCEGGSLKLTLTNTAGASVASAGPATVPTDGDTADNSTTLTPIPTPLASSVAGIRISIEGPSDMSRRRLLVVCIVGLAVFATAGVALAASLGVTSAKLTTYVAASSVPGCTAPGTQTVSSNADSWVDQQSATNNFGGDSILKVRSLTSSSNMRAFVRFGLPALPSGCTVTLATLRLYAGSSSSGRTLNAHRVSSSWTESGVNWNNQPSVTGTPATTASGAGWRQWTVTTLAQAMYSGTNNGFRVADSVENASGGFEQQLHSKEKAPDNPPELVITFG